MQKLVASYAILLFITTSTLIFSIVGLYAINKTAKDIILTDLPAIVATSQLRENLLAQERYAGKFLILRDPDLKKLLNDKELEFARIVEELRKKGAGAPLSTLTVDYEAYRRQVDQALGGPSTDALPARKEAERVFNDIDSLSASRQKILAGKLAQADRHESTTVRMTLILSFAGITLALSIAALFIHNISSAIRKLKRGTHRIAEGDFDYNLQVAPGDEFGSLADDFTRMAHKLKEYEQICLDASPLTRLPGNISIERHLDDKLREGTPFAVCYADLDNFKAYNDRYGFIKASDVIKMTGEIIERTVRSTAGDAAFVGHVGGDDFVMVVPAGNATAVCETVISAFTAMIREQYTADDLARGAIEGVDRYGVHRTFPIMTISIAVIVCHRGEYGSATEIAEAALEIKDRLKGMKGSNYFIYGGKGA